MTQKTSSSERKPINISPQSKVLHKVINSTNNMETPRTLRQRPIRNPTPRLSERKKSLFSPTRSEVTEMNSDSEQENYTLDGVAPLSGQKNKKIPNKNHTTNVSSKAQLKAISFLKNSNSSPERMDDDVFDKLPESPSPPQNDLILSPTSGRQLRARNKLPPSTNPSTTPSPSSRRSNGAPSTPPQQKVLGDELPTLFTNSMNLNKQKILEEDIVEESSEEEQVSRTPTTRRKRNNLTSSDADTVSVAKVRRVDNSEKLYIPTKSFYSHKKPSPVLKTPPLAQPAKRSPKSKRHKPDLGIGINKGVRHKIRRKPKHTSALMATKIDVMSILKTIQNEKLRNLLTAKRLEKDQIENCHRILNYGKNPIEMAKPLSVIGGGASKPACPNNDDNNNNGGTEIASGTCYDKRSGAGEVSLGFSDIECSTESEDELQTTESTGRQSVYNESDEELENRVPTPVAGRKFFKSGYTTTRKEVNITGNIKASMQNGKLTLVQKQKRKRIKLRNNQTNEFSSEQARVDEILKTLDVSAIVPDDGDAPPAPDFVNQVEVRCTTPALSVEGSEVFEEMRMTENEEDDDCQEFRRRLPYNTDDPEVIEQQHTLLDFLITNKICNEENFITFIADPENHKEEAQKIIDQIVVVVAQNTEDFRQRIPYNTTNPAEIEQQKNFVQFLIENDLCTEENFQIFIADYANRQEEADRIITEVVARTHNISAEDLERELSKFNEQHADTSMELEIPDQNKHFYDEVAAPKGAAADKYFPVFYPGRCQPLREVKSSRKGPRSWTGGLGLNQYQIDAGQKQFGARQCKQCGLVYSVREPEEERLHKDFHSSLFILKFKSWIDEDIVQIYPEWGNDGRIIRITNNSHLKRQERVALVLQLVDKELGFSSYIMPKTYTAYFAVRQSQIVGICLAEPLTKAHRYISLDGVDCCTEETFDAKCGISRIWVSPLHRRFHIATKLIRAVQLYTIFGEEIPLDKLAFSAPTQDGKRFAKNVTKTENFLVYQ